MVDILRIPVYGMQSGVQASIPFLCFFGHTDILLCHKGASTGDPQIFRHFGIEPTLYDLIIVKANTSFRVPYGKFTELICYGDTPGAGASNLKLLQWKHLPKGLYPFDLPKNHTLPEPKTW